MFKRKLSVLLVGCQLMVCTVSAMGESKNFSLQIKGLDAKRIFLSLTGSQVKNDAAMSHQYRQGRDVLCQYIDADMDDTAGHPITAEDASRYTCTIQFNQDGIQ